MSFLLKEHPPRGRRIAFRSVQEPSLSMCPNRRRTGLYHNIIDSGPARYLHCPAGPNKETPPSSQLPPGTPDPPGFICSALPPSIQHLGRPL
ncbi:hypothetical protein BC835DRAFT_87574 [Cytidiella melzeri]|nr:hypothetical protein BC835DRAFT_87574 [Cytidiella melzeri]